MLVFDFDLLLKDRHGGNIYVLRIADTAILHLFVLCVFNGVSLAYPLLIPCCLSLLRLVPSEELIGSNL